MSDEIRPATTIPEIDILERHGSKSSIKMLENDNMDELKMIDAQAVVSGFQMAGRKETVRLYWKASLRCHNALDCDGSCLPNSPLCSVSLPVLVPEWTAFR